MTDRTTPQDATDALYRLPTHRHPVANGADMAPECVMLNDVEAALRASVPPLDVERLNSGHQLDAEQRGLPVPFAPCTCNGYPSHQHRTESVPGEAHDD